MPTRKKTAPKKTAAKKEPKPSPKVSEPSQLDRIEGMLTDLTKQVGLDSHNSIMSHLQVQMGFRKRMCEEHREIISRLASLSQPTVEQAAPRPMEYREQRAIVGQAISMANKHNDLYCDKPLEERVGLVSINMALGQFVEPHPEGLQPGDYTDASKEVADALTAMGWEWLNHYQGQGHDYIRLSTYKMGQLTNSSALHFKPNHLTPSEFLSRASVTAKEIGLVPVVEEDLQDGELVTQGDGYPATAHQWTGEVRRVVSVSHDRVLLEGLDGRKFSGHFMRKDVRKLSAAEIKQHLAEQEARAREEKLAKLKAMKPGTPIKVKGKKQCTFIALERECLVWYAHNEDESYYAALCGASEVTVIEQP